MLTSQSHSAATTGWLWLRSLQGQTALLLLLGQLLPSERLSTVACHLCGCPVLHLPLLHQTFLLLWGVMVMLPRWALASWSHSCCSCGARRQMSGPACSLDPPAKQAGVVLCSGRKILEGRCTRLGCYLAWPCLVWRHGWRSCAALLAFVPGKVHCMRLAAPMGSGACKVGGWPQAWFACKSNCPDFRLIMRAA